VCQCILTWTLWSLVHAWDPQCPILYVLIILINGIRQYVASCLRGRAQSSKRMCKLEKIECLNEGKHKTNTALDSEWSLGLSKKNHPPPQKKKKMGPQNYYYYFFFGGGPSKVFMSPMMSKVTWSHCLDKRDPSGWKNPVATTLKWSSIFGRKVTFLTQRVAFSVMQN